MGFKPWDWAKRTVNRNVSGHSRPQRWNSNQMIRSPEGQQMAGQVGRMNSPFQQYGAPPMAGLGGIGERLAGGGMTPPGQSMMPDYSGGDIGFSGSRGGGGGGGIGERLLGGLKDAWGWVEDNPELAGNIAGAGANMYGAYKEGQAVDDQIKYQRQREREERERKDAALEKMREELAAFRNRI